MILWSICSYIISLIEVIVNPYLSYNYNVVTFSMGLGIDENENNDVA